MILILAATAALQAADAAASAPQLSVIQAVHGSPPDQAARPAVDAGGLDWLTPASADDLRAAYPLCAIPRRLEDHLKLRCVAKADGRMSRCKVVEDDQPGLGFDEAARGLVRLYRMPATTRDGSPITGAVFVIPFNFIYDRPALSSAAQ